jgi:hypothetical protein
MKSKLKFKIPIYLLFFGGLGFVGVIFSVFSATRYQEMDNPTLAFAGSLLLIFSTGYLATYSIGKLFKELLIVSLDERDIRVFYILTLRTKIIPWKDVTGYHISSIITGRYKTKMVEVFTIHTRTNEKLDIVEYYHKNYSKLVKELKMYTNNYLGYQPYKHGIFGRRYTNDYQK